MIINRHQNLPPQSHKLLAITYTYPPAEGHLTPPSPIRHPIDELPSLLGLLLLLGLLGDGAVLLNGFLLGRDFGLGFFYRRVGATGFIAVFPGGFGIETFDFLLSLGDILLIALVPHD